VGCKTLNMVGGEGINSPHPPTSRYQHFPARGRTGQSGAPPVRHRCANGRFQRLVLTLSRWADGTPDSPMHYPVHCPVRHYNSTLKPALSGFCVGKALPRASLAPPGRGCTGQSCAHQIVWCPRARNPTSCFSAVFQIGFHSNL
jgi:hypothetical protein